MADPNEWQPMTSAPKDGTEIELLMHHPNRKFAEGSEQDQWTQIVRAKWIDFNHGGWTWSGMYGNPQGWRPIATAAAHGDCWSAFPGVCDWPECVCPGGERDPARGVPPSQAQSNPCKLTECQGKPRCEPCKVMDRAYGVNTHDGSKSND